MLYLLFFIFLPYVYGGSQCGPRSDIYPCICIDRKIGKSKFDTTLVCRGINEGHSLLAIEPALSEMEINNFLLYDSYWSNGLRRSQADSEIPINILSSFRIQEIKIVDTAMSFFACPQEYNCRTSYVKKLTAINSTLPERSLCNNNGHSINSWISCPGIIEEVTIDKGFSNNVSIKSDFFPKDMPKLKALRMPRNNIVRIDRKTFSLKTFPVLQILDLSYNNLRDGKSLFSSVMQLTHLDLSHNNLRTIPDFQYLPNLHTLNLTNNEILTLVTYEWQNVPASLRVLDLTDNTLDCSCGIKFINSTFHINAVLLGQCSGGSRVKGKTLRKAARFLSERCDEKGNIGSKHKPKAEAVQE